MDIALVGMDCVLPGAAGAEAWIAAGLAGRLDGALREAPAGRFPVPLPTARRAGEPDAITTAIGGFVTEDVSVAVDPERLGGLDLAALDPLYRWVVRVVGGALDGVRGDRRRASLVLGNLSLPSTGAIGAMSGPYASLLDHPLGSTSPHDRFHSGLPALLAARAYGLGGPACALDAACASGLYAVQLAIAQLTAGEVDLAVAAGVQRSDAAFLFLGFSQLRALSATGAPRPFDRRADGLVIGEGAAAAAVERLPDALRDGDRIHAVLEGGGLGNDGRSGNLLAPDPAGQLRAMRAAYARAGVAPASVGYVECHATGTTVGDRAEVASLTELMAGHRPVIGSAKALVGHVVTAAGLVGLIRAVGAVREGVLPASPHVGEPIDGVGPDAALRVLDRPAAWTEPIRRAAVSAFGFGGTDAHVVLRSWDPSATAIAPLPDAAPAGPTRLAITAIAAHLGDAPHADAVRDALRRGQPRLRPADDAVHRGAGKPELGAWIDAITVDTAAARMAPADARKTLPQQLLALTALADVARVAGDPARTASVVGMGIDGQVGEHVLRTVARPDRGDAIAPALDAARVQGVLPNFVANRAAAVLDLQGASYAVSAESLSGAHALAHAHALLQAGDADAVLVAAVDLPGQVGALAAARAAGQIGPVGEGVVALCVRRAADVEPSQVLAYVDRVELGAAPAPTTTPWRAVFGHTGAADALVGLLYAAAGEGTGPIALAEHGAGATLSITPGAAQRWTGPALPMERPVDVPHSGAALPLPAWTGPWDAAERVPAPIPGRRGPRAIQIRGPLAAGAATLPWAAWTKAATPVAPPPPTPPEPARRPPPAAQARFATPSPHLPRPELLGVAELAEQLARTSDAMATAHAAWLQGEEAALQAIAAFGTAGPLTRPLPPRPVAPAWDPAPEPPQAPAPEPAAPPPPPAAVMGRAELVAFAEGPLSAALGPAYADLDAIEPRVRLPMDPLLLVSRVTELNATRGELGACSLVTEYDIPADAWWSHDGKAPPAVVVESGQADLLLAAALGVDELTQGRRVYRLLDCDLTFHGPRPALGETLRHAIRIHRFVRLADKLLFYFEYDCTAPVDGRKVLTMRGGCAGFFTPAELSRPQGLRLPATTPDAVDVPPRIAGAPTELDGAAMAALEQGDLAGALGPVFAAGSTSGLRLPPSPWRVVHRVTELRTTGGPHGHGGLVATQDLRDDDWFNACHFKGDPCMPGTLMFDGCTQAVAVWLLAAGAAVGVEPGATFEPIAERPVRLRCRGQVVPGHSRLDYEVRVREAHLDDPQGAWALADVILHVDGLPAVIAHDVGVRVDGRRVAQPALPVPDPAANAVYDLAALLEFSVGKPSRCFGPALAPFDHGEQRTPRMPGPPLLCLTEVLSVEGARGEVRGDVSVRIAYDVEPDAWFLSAAPGAQADVPLVLALEIALQPCGWLTAYQGAALVAGGDVYFRNLGGEVQVVAPLTGDVGRIVTTATVTSVSQSAGMILYFFDLEVASSSGVLLRGNTHFGYFTAASLRNQKGLQPPAAEEAARADRNAAARLDPPLALDGPFAPRADLRMIDRVVAADDAGGEHGLGWYAAELDVDRAAWFFTAHFHQDPVMPGSLGLEALAQLAAWALGRRFPDAPPHLQTAPEGATWSWKYRGQVPPTRERVELELEVVSVGAGHAPRLVCRGLVRGDGLPIYAFEGLEVCATAAPARAVPSATAPTATAARRPLLDHFDPATGQGALRLDPAAHPWLADHCPDLVTPALPMAFAAEIAAEAAVELAPEARVIGLPRIEAMRWITAEDGPLDVIVRARRQADEVHVELLVHVDTPRYPALSGPKPHMRAVVELGERWHPAPEAPATPDLPDAALSAAAYYGGGLTFHGPALHVMRSLGVRGDGLAEATLAARPDQDALGAGRGSFTLDPCVLDGATHPMMSGLPETWSAAIPPGRLAYPVRCDGLRLFGPRPEAGTEVRCRLELVEATTAALVFDVWMIGAAGPWCAFRWTEALVDGGPILGAPPEHRRPFALHRQPVAGTRVGRARDGGWRVDHHDLVGPLPSSLPRILLSPRELDGWRAAPEPRPWLAALVAAKEACRSHLHERLGRDVHPRDLRLVRTRPDRFVVSEAPCLTAQELVDHLGPTRFDVVLHTDSQGAQATVRPRGVT